MRKQVPTSRGSAPPGAERASPFSDLAPLTPAAPRAQNSPAPEISLSRFDGRELTCLRRGNCTLLHQPSPQPEIGALRITLLGGANLESEAERGLRHAIEHVYLREILEGPVRKTLAFGNIGRFEITGETALDRVTFAWWGPEKFLPAAVDAFSKTLLRGEAASEEALSLESIRIRTEALERSTSPQALVSRDLHEALIPGSHALTDLAGGAPRFETITVSSMQTMLRERLLPAGVCVSVVGGSKDLLDVVDAALALTSGSTHTSAVEGATSLREPRTDKLPLIYRVTNEPMASVGVAFPNLESNDPRGQYAILLRQVFISLLQVTLNDYIYEKIAPVQSHTNLGGYQGGIISCLPEVVPAIVDRVRKVAETLCTKDLDPDYFDGLRKKFLERNVQGPSLSASGVAHFAEERGLGRIGFSDFEALARYASLMSLREFHEVAREVLSPVNLAFVIHSPSLNEAKLEGSEIVRLPPTA